MEEKEILQRYEKICTSLPKEQLREAEETLFLPKKYYNPVIDGEVKRITDRTFNLFIANPQDVSLIEKHLGVHSYTNNSKVRDIRNTNILLSLLREIEEGRIIIDNGKIRYRGAS